MIIQLNYDLNKTGQNYDGLIEKIKTVGTSWANPCKSCWLIRTNKSATEIYNALKPYLDSNDRILVNEFNANNYSGWLSQEIWDWIRASENSNYLNR